MLKLNHLEVSNYIVWREASLVFRPGVTFIHGKNRAGKTILGRAIKRALRGADFDSKRGTSASKLPPKSRLRLAFAIDKDEWNVEATASKVSLHLNGKSLGLSGKRSGLKKLLAELPISNDLFDATIFLSGKKPHRLQDTSPVQTADWLASVFRIDVMYDALLEQASGRLTAARKAAAQIDALQINLSGLGASASKADLAAADKAHVRARSKLGEVREALSDVTTVLPLLRQAADLPRLPKKPVGAEASLEAEVTRLDRRLAAFNEYSIRLEAYREALAAWKNGAARLEEMCREVGVKDPAAAAKRLEVTKRARGLAARPFMRVLAKRERWKAEAAARFVAKNRAPLPGAEFTRLIERSRKLDRAELEATLDLNKAQALPDGECPTCGQPCDHRHRRSVVNEIAMRLKDIKPKARKLRQRLVVAKACAAVTVRQDPRPAVRGFKQLRARLDFSIDLLGRIVEAAEHMPAPPKKPEAPKGFNSRASAQKRRDAVNERLSAVCAYRDLSQRHADVQKSLNAFAKTLRRHGSTPAEQLRNSAKESGRLLAAVGKLEAEVAETSAKASTLREQLRIRQSIGRQVKELRPLADDVIALEALVDAFGRTGLRLRRLEGITAAFEATLNEAIPLLWPEGTRITTSIEAKGVHIRLTRSTGGESDLSALSGSEEQVWKMLCAYALLRILPPSLRCDTVILDELEANLDEESREKFVKRFIPALSSVIPNVVIVSPQSRALLPIDAATFYRIRFDKQGRSVLKDV